MERFEKLKAVLKQYYKAGAVVAGLMVVLGIVILCFPKGTLTVMQWALFIGFFVSGIFRILLYARLPYGMRFSSMLVVGVLDVLCSAGMILATVRSPEITAAGFQSVVGYMLAFYAIVSGIDTLCSCGFVRLMGGAVGWTVLAGVLHLAAGILMLFEPVLSVLWVELCVAICLIVEGATVLVNLIGIRVRLRRVREEADAAGLFNAIPYETTARDAE